MEPILRVAEAADDFFAGRSPVHAAARLISRTLEEMAVPFAVAGALAANAHGYRRTTVDVDLLITAEGLAAFKARWLGRGWTERFPGGKGLRDTANGVDIDLLVTGDYPGDGQPKPVAFPHPAAASLTGEDGVPVLTLAVLVELKLASGLSAPHRLQDLADVIALIRANGLGREYGRDLHAFVREKYEELWQAAQQANES